MQIIKIDPRALNENADDARQSNSSPQGAALGKVTTFLIARPFTSFGGNSDL
ncbi:hypothetical protein [Sinorhizobium fredii]|uniref:hypothetical protein n=1 Tax=Rhizobium fredii TaxID=380 RepID=UPI003512B9BD